MADYTVDVAVIGAGIAGVGIAAELSRKRNTLVIEAEDQPGYHSTGRSAAIFIKHYGNQTIKKLTAAAEAFYRNPPAEVTETPLLSPRGELMLSDGTDEELFAEHVVGSSVLTEISPSEALAMVPILRPEKVKRAAREEASDIDVNALHQGWLRLFRKRGGTLLTNARVSGLKRDAGRWEITTPAGTVSAKILVNAAGAWADRVAQMAGLKPVGLTPYRRSMAVLPAPDGYDISKWPLFGPARELWYCKPEAGQLYVSPAEEHPVEPHDAYPDDMVLAEGLDRFEQAVTMPVTRILRSWAGLRTFAPDRTLVVGFDPAAEDFFWVAGQGGYGIQTSPAVSRLGAGLIDGTPPDDFDQETVIARLDPGRFR
ncbi:D-arginine dehydrogenase [Rhodoligotrophos appendicifer]|uniref:NAD(P)/FAD-dependent oxidoreductase n=1 Tax=Rhodoligotrophos appendicifer TaxID=987056 RepID=UPI001185B61F|nr:FAD-binding oxidoreductase [Rhodoligotrophos appendicifer]